MKPLYFSGITQIPSTTNITHSGDTIKVLFKTAKPITVTGGVFKNKVYEFQQLHFHWGKNTHEGSEHTVESRRFPLECHLVFYKENCTNPTSEPECIAVLGVHYESKWVGSNVLDPIVKATAAIEQVGEYVAKVNGYPLKQYLPKDLGTYFSYTGSLTTPPCTEGVTWIWFTETMKVSPHQVNILHEITDEYGHKVESNFRGTQPLNGRSVYLINSA
uniref:Carbonic anhydrase 9 n=1 Tax=Lygus hesperus TaxID=30085 RepID=A0A0A9WSI9_LYGHE